MNADGDRRKLMSYVFATEALAIELENNSPLAAQYLLERKTINISVDNPVFSVYIHLTKCLTAVYGDSTNLSHLNDAIFTRGIATLYEDLAAGDVPILIHLPPEEIAMMQHMRETLENAKGEELESLNRIIKETPNVVN